jgi:hypothetical protein
MYPRCDHRVNRGARQRSPRSADRRFSWRAPLGPPGARGRVSCAPSPAMPAGRRLSPACITLAFCCRALQQDATSERSEQGAIFEGLVNSNARLGSALAQLSPARIQLRARTRANGERLLALLGRPDSIPDITWLILWSTIAPLFRRDAEVTVKQSDIVVVCHQILRERGKVACDLQRGTSGRYDRQEFRIGLIGPKHRKLLHYPYSSANEDSCRVCAV